MVRELPTQGIWLDAWEKEDADATGASWNDAMRYCTYASVDSLDTALKRACCRAEVNLPFLSAYGFRHRVVSVLRASKAPNVPTEQISYQMGHRRHSERITRGYGEYGFDYLADAATALDRWVSGLMAAADLNSHGFPTNGHTGVTN